MNFGFSISPSSHIIMDDVSRKRFDALKKTEPDIAVCMSCGSCTATCTAGTNAEVSLRRMILMLQRGKDDEALAMASRCLLCGKCYLVCPRGINTRHVLLSISKCFGHDEDI